MGSSVPNWILLSTLLHNLGDSYKSFVSSTLQNICSTEPDLNQIISSLFDKTTALLTKKGNLHSSHCNCTNHLINDCWRLHPGKAPKNKNKRQHQKDKVNKKNKKKNKNRTNNQNEDNKDKTGDVLMSASSSLLARQTDTWFIDLGTTQYMCLNRASFINYVHNISLIYLGDLTPIKVERQGHVTPRLQGSSVTFTNVLHVPSLTTNLLFVFCLFSKGCKVQFEKKRCTIYCSNGIYLATRKQEENLFHLSMSNHAFIITGLPQALSIKLWHQRLGHLGLENV